MNTAGIAAVLAAALALSACAGTGSAGPEVTPPGDPAAAASVSGTWRAADSMTAAGSTVPAEVARAFIGTAVEIGPQRVVGVRGNRCEIPVFATSLQPPGDFFAGAGLDPAAFGITQPTAEVVTVTCGGAPFDRFLRIADGTLVTGFDGAYFRLEKSGSTAFGPSAPPPPAARSPAHGAAAEPVDPAHALHLASYRSAGDAERGWQVLSGRFRELRGLTPVYTNILVPGRGLYNRLLVVGPPAAELRALCLRLRQAGQYCAPMDLDSAAARAATPAEPAPTPAGS